MNTTCKASFGLLRTSRKTFNSLAWFRPSVPEDRFRNGPRGARELAARGLCVGFGAAFHVPGHSLAAAHAECGEFTLGPSS